MSTMDIDLNPSLVLMNDDTTSQEVAGNLAADCKEKTTSDSVSLKNEFFNSAHASKANPQQHELEVDQVMKSDPGEASDEISVSPVVDLFELACFVFHSVGRPVTNSEAFDCQSDRVWNQDSPVGPNFVAPAVIFGPGKRQATACKKTRIFKTKTTQKNKTEAQKKSGTYCHQEASTQLCEIGFKAAMNQPGAAAPVCSKKHPITSLEDILDVTSRKPTIKADRFCCAKKLRTNAFQYLIKKFEVREGKRESGKNWEDHMTRLAISMAPKIVAKDPGAVLRYQKHIPTKTSVLKYILAHWM